MMRWVPLVIGVLWLLACKPPPPASSSTSTSAPDPPAEIHVAPPPSAEATEDRSVTSAERTPPIFDPSPRDCWSRSEIEERDGTIQLKIDADDCEHDWCLAAEQGNPDTPLVALEHYGDPVAQCRCEGGRTLLHVAAEAGHRELVHHLLIRGARSSVCDPQGLTPLHYGAREGLEGVVSSLLTAGADPNAAAIDGRRALHAALKRLPLRTPVEYLDFDRYMRTISDLVERGADVNAADVEGNRPLHLAVPSGELELLELLVQNGADVNATNAEGLRPDELAWSKEVVEWLQSQREPGAAQ